MQPFYAIDDDDLEPAVALEDWGKRLGDVPTATAILDRLLHHAEVVRMNGRSDRLKDRPGPSPDVPPDSRPAKAPTGSEEGVP